MPVVAFERSISRQMASVAIDKVFLAASRLRYDKRVFRGRPREKRHVNLHIALETEHVLQRKMAGKRPRPILVEPVFVCTQVVPERRLTSVIKESNKIHVDRNACLMENSQSRGPTRVALAGAHMHIRVVSTKVRTPEKSKIT